MHTQMRWRWVNWCQTPREGNRIDYRRTWWREKNEGGAPPPPSIGQFHHRHAKRCVTKPGWSLSETQRVYLTRYVFKQDGMCKLGQQRFSRTGCDCEFTQRIYAWVELTDMPTSKNNIYLGLQRWDRRRFFFLNKVLLLHFYFRDCILGSKS